MLKGLPSAKARVFVTSRPHPHDIKQCFEDALRVDIEAKDADIKHYCSSVIKGSANLTEIMDDSLKQQVVDTILSKAHGM